MATDSPDSRPTLDFDMLANADTLLMTGRSSTESFESTSKDSSMPENQGEQAAPAAKDSAAPASAAVPSEVPPTTAKHAGGDPKVDMEVAITNFACHQGFPKAEVTEGMVQRSKEGVYYWATLKLDCSARGPGAQAMGRQFKYRPDMKAAYNVLLDSMKADFRRAWIATKSFDFTTTTRSTTNAFRKRREEIGRFVTKLQLEVILGGSDKEEATQQAGNYIQMCLRPDLKDCNFGKVYIGQYRALISTLNPQPLILKSKP